MFTIISKAKKRYYENHIKRQKERIEMKENEIKKLQEELRIAKNNNMKLIEKQNEMLKRNTDYENNIEFLVNNLSPAKRKLARQEN